MVGFRGFARAALIVLIAAAPARADEQPVVFRAVTQSPRPLTPTDARSGALYAACGVPDAALAEVALRVARSDVERGSLPDADETAFALHAAGDAHAWPRVFGASGAGLDDSEADTLRSLHKWATTGPTLGVRRCGVGRAAKSGGNGALVAVVVDALADMAPLPSQARVGQWLTLEGTMLVPASDLKVILLGPRGAPRTVVASLSGSRVRSAFSVDEPGTWLVQVLATVSTGPRPVLEAMVFAGVAPPSRYVAENAVGESGATGAVDDADAMTRMTNAARRSEGLSVLRRDAGLDGVARAHSAAMQRVRMTGHDVGDGPLTTRVDAAGVSYTRAIGENVAFAASTPRAHRALWNSPSHRTNLLYPSFTRLGIGVVRDADGSVWVSEVFGD